MRKEKGEPRGMKPSYSVREAPRKVIDDLNNKTSGVKGREERVDNKHHAWEV